MNATNFKMAILVALAALTLGNGESANAAGEVYETQVVSPGISISNGRFGTAIEIAGDIAAVTTKNTPYTYIYRKRAPGYWLKRATLSTGLNSFKLLDVAIADKNHEGNYTVVVSGYLDYWVQVPVMVVFTGDGSSWSRSAVIDGIPGAQLPNMPIALDGDRLALAAEDSILVYKIFSNGWTLVSDVETPSRPCGGIFSCIGNRSVAISGNSVFVGEPDGSGSAYKSGIVYVYEYRYSSYSTPGSYTLYPDPYGSGSGFTQLQHTETLQAPDGASDDGFGAALATDGGRVLVGAPRADSSAIDTGAMYIFSRGYVGFAFEARLSIAGGEPGDRVGSAVALDGDVAVAGSVTSSGTGSAHVFTRSTNRFGFTSWNRRSELVPGIERTNDGFGYAVAIDGNSILVGAPRRYGTRSYEGAAFAFACSTSVTDCWKYQ